MHPSGSEVGDDVGMQVFATSVADAVFEAIFALHQHTQRRISVLALFSFQIHNNSRRDIDAPLFIQICIKATGHCEPHTGSSMYIVSTDMALYLHECVCIYICKLQIQTCVCIYRPL